TPALCALFLRRSHSIQKDIKFKNESKPSPSTGINKRKKKFFKGFNNQFEKFTNFYVRSVQFLLKRSLLTIGIMLGIIGIGVLLMIKTPSSFIPTEDDSFLTYSITMPPGA